MSVPRWFVFAVAAFGVMGGYALGLTQRFVTAAVKPERTCMAIFEVDGSKYEATVSGRIDEGATSVSAEIEHKDGQWRMVESMSLKCAPAVRNVEAR